jgi:hypothetical protein
MTSEARMHANRRNARKSTGPRTPEGKGRVAHNAVRHGILCDLAVLPTESRAEFEEFRDALVGDLAPLGGLEQVLAERIVAGSWRLRRVLHHETCLIDRDSGRSLYHEHKMGLVDERQPGDRVHPAAMGEALTESLGAPHSAYDTLRRYERAIQRDLEVCLRDLDRLQGHRDERQRRREGAEKNCGLRIADRGLKKAEQRDDPATRVGFVSQEEGNGEPGTGNGAQKRGNGQSGPGSSDPVPGSPVSVPSAGVGFVSQEGRSASAATPEPAAASGVPSPNPQSEIRDPQSLPPVGFVSQEGDWRGRGPRRAGDHVDEHGVLRDITGRRIERIEPDAAEAPAAPESPAAPAGQDEEAKPEAAKETRQEPVDPLVEVMAKAAAEAEAELEESMREAWENDLDQVEAPEEEEEKNAR